MLRVCPPCKPKFSFDEQKVGTEELSSAAANAILFSGLSGRPFLLLRP